ncbi:hypothetical protein GCM10009789_23860 [Kribbella sancticallisti]|uniref:Uncharacterized protein n=1 Tax=Kribbella sancticallisti TaxID=460087 RepID=A0ABN2D3H4_9ACTN
MAPVSRHWCIGTGVSHWRLGTARATDPVAGTDTVAQKGVPADIDPDSIDVFSDTPFVRTQ